MHVTLIHPRVGRRAGQKGYVRTWKMEPMPPATLAALIPSEVERCFFDDRMEAIPFDAPTDLVAISVETYTAKRAYQIASEYRRRGVPVVMGGFHATLCPDEVERYADSVVVGEAELLFPELIDDYRAGTPKRRYTSASRPTHKVRPDRSIYAHNRYLPVRLVEFARGCRFSCDFCAIQSFYKSTHTHRDIDQVLEEIAAVRRMGQMIFFVDDNINSSPGKAKELMRTLIPLKIRWVSQSSINVAWDKESLDLMRRSGCQGVLVGLESLNPDNLDAMDKGFNLMKGGPSAAMAAFREHGLRVYGTFVFGYDHDSPEGMRSTLDWARDEALFIGAFNHITPFPGTPLFARLQEEGRLLYDAWWLDEGYRYGEIPFRPAGMSPEDLADICAEARRVFYSWPHIFRRAAHRVHLRDPWMLLNFLVINAMHHFDIDTRMGMPMGDEDWKGELLEVT
ncbi:MAG: B12-binding domain-containing radical SAM protein [Verrucomicrobia bacterium]|nr:B12-binding domain-containing radical SAM protein [Verrucomicrobiota bacterium]MCH8512396.1 B12-binding domain-containing radical SAM protein [Kiritimatiellia bacterium]